MAIQLIRSVIAAASRDPERAAILEVGSSRWRTRREILSAAIHAARRLDRLAEPGATVILHGPGGAGYWAGLLAVFGTGRRLLPVGPETTAADFDALLASHRVAVVLRTNDSVEPFRTDDSVHEITIDFVAPEKGADDDPFDRAGDASLLLRSSGSTGRPGVVLRDSSAIDRVAETLVDVLDLVEEDRVLATIPMQHAYGIEHGVLAPMRAGASVAFKAGFDLRSGAEALLDGTTVFPAVPVTLEAAARIGRTGTDLRLAYTAGTRLPESVREAFVAAWGVPVGDLYGMTEIGTITWGIDGAGRAVAGVSIGVIDPSDATGSPEIRREGEGEIVVRSDAMLTGYLEDGSGAAEPGRRIDGHLRTGDLGRIDAEGRLRITGRAKLQFDVGGLKVNPEDVEKMLLEVEGVKEVAVVPLDLSETVTRVMAVIVGDHQIEPGPLEALVRAECRRTLPSHQRPRVIRVVSELPRSATGKLLRGRLMDDAAVSGPGERGR
ncbi:MAG: acyl--CoA ligase [Phycisphaera sp.]|nr:acyl--CoA ligase [Phycisphaera sp.]